MSHQSGITAGPELQSFLTTCKDGSVRVLRVSIINEQLQLTHHKSPERGWEEDYDNMVLPLLEESQPCYILYRLDSMISGSFQWIFISYSPDDSPVREKMLYASTRSTLKKIFGGSVIKDEMFGTMHHDVSLRGYKKHIISQQAAPPLTMAEEELAEVKKKELGTTINIDTKQQTATGVSFPLTDQAIHELGQLKQGNRAYVQLRLNIEKELIELDRSSDLTIVQLASQIPVDHARYHLFNFKHTHEGDFTESIVFIYSVPAYNCPIKERMLYSSCKAPLIDVIEGHIGIELAKKIEIDDPVELTEAYLYDEIHPKKNVARQQFSRPKGPVSRGPKRLTKQKGDEEQ